MNDQWVDFEGHNGLAKYQCTFETKWRGVTLNLMPLSFVVRTRGTSWQRKNKRAKGKGRKEKKAKEGQKKVEESHIIRTKATL